MQWPFFGNCASMPMRPSFPAEKPPMTRQAGVQSCGNSEVCAARSSDGGSHLRPPCEDNCADRMRHRSIPANCDETHEYQCGCLTDMSPGRGRWREAPLRHHSAQEPSRDQELTYSALHVGLPGSGQCGRISLGRRIPPLKHAARVAGAYGARRQVFHDHRAGSHDA